MRRDFIISAIVGIIVAGTATATLAKPGDQYTLYAGGCLPGDIVNPAGSAFHCTEAISVNPNGNAVASKAVRNMGGPSGPTAREGGIADQAASGNLTSFLHVSCKTGETAESRDGKATCIPSNKASQTGDMPK